MRAWQSEDGLPGTAARSLVQSSDGFLWVATAEGIARFDGSEFEPIDMPPETTLSRLGPNRLFATPGGAVWFSDHGGGLLRIDSGHIRRILDDVISPNGTPPPNPLRVTQVVAINPTTIVARRDQETWLISANPPRLLDPPAPALTAAFAADLANRSQAGRILPDNTIGALADRAGRTWSYEPGRGITVKDRDEHPLKLDLSAFDESIAVSELMEDREGNVWVASPVSGLIRFRQRRVEVFESADGLSDRATNAVIEDPDGGFWIGTRPGGVDHVTGDTIKHYEFGADSRGARRRSPGPRRSVSALFFDRDRNLWAASRDGSVFRWSNNTFEVAFPRQPDPSKIDAIYQDGRGVLWFGGSRGLCRVDQGRISMLGTADGFPGGHVTAMDGMAGGSLWFGTYDGRIFRDEIGRIVPIGNPADLGHHKVTGILVEDSNRAWVSTLGAGLHCWDGRQWNRFDRQQALPDPRLTCIIADHAGYFWFGSLGGIIRISRAELLAHIGHPDAPLHWLRIDRSDGLPTRECSGSAQPAGWLSDDGGLRFPTVRGLVRIDPASIEIDRSPPPVFLREIRANGRPLQPDQNRYSAGPGRTRLEISYHGLGFSAPEKMTYRTRLIPLDPAWREAGTERTATYEAVPPGRFRFEVVAINGDGVASEFPAAIDVVVRPLFWQTPWFVVSSIVAAIATATATGWASARARLKRRIQQLNLQHAAESERARIARDLHDDLGARVTEISLLAGLGIELDDPAQLRGSLEEISAKTHNLVDSLDEIVWAVNPREDTLPLLAEYLTASAGEFLARAGIPLRLDGPRDLPDLAVPSSTRHSVFLAVRETLNNLVRHSHATSARLAIAWQPPALSITIQDNGRGLPEHVVAGYGLDNLRSRMRDCGGQCSIDSIEGTTIRLTIPLCP